MEQRYWFSVEVYNKDGEFIGDVTGHNVLAESESEAKRKAREYGRDHYPSSSYKIENAKVGRM